MAESSEEIVPRRKPKILRILLLLAVILVAAFVIYRFNLTRRLERRLDAIRAAGYPVTGAELNDWYSIPNGAANAADTLLLAFTHYQKWKDSFEEQLPVVGQADLPLRTEPLNEDMRQLIADYLADNQQAIELLHEGAAIEHSRYPIDFSLGFNALMPYLSEIRTAAYLLQLEAILNAENSDPQLAVRSIISGFGMARSVSKEPVLVSQLTRFGCQRNMVSGLERILNRIQFTDSQLADLAGAFVDAQSPESMARAFAGERCPAVGLLRNPSVEVIQSLSSHNATIAPVIWLYRTVGLADRDAMTYIGLVDEYLEATALPLHRRIGVAKAITRRIEDVHKSRILLRMLAPAWRHIAILEARTAAQLRMAEMAIAALRCRLATGKVPETLSELVPTYINTVAKDPFDGKNLRYRKTDTGFVVYSIAKDRCDDSGREMPSPSDRRKDKSLTYDITFTIGQ